jgi:hypothetical protein
MTPARITLRRDTDPCFFHPDAIASRMTALRRAGFMPAGHYVAEQLDDMGLVGLYHPGRRLLAMIWDHPTLPARFELSAHFADGGFVKVSNHPVYRDEAAPAGSRIAYGRDADIGAALALLDADVPAAGRVTIDDRNLVAYFEDGWARAMDGLIRVDRISDAFILDNVAAWGIRRPLDDEDLESLRGYFRRCLASSVESACIGNFLQSGSVDAARWERLRARVVVVHERMPRESVLALFARCLPDTPVATLRQRFATATAEGLGLFEQINESLPEAQRLRRLGSVAEPVAATICARP